MNTARAIRVSTAFSSSWKLAGSHRGYAWRTIVVVNLLRSSAAVISFDKYNVVYSLAQNRVQGMGVYDPKFGPLKHIAERPAEQRK